MRRIIEIFHQLINNSLISYLYHSYHSITFLFTNKLIFYSCLIWIQSSLHIDIRKITQGVKEPKSLYEFVHTFLICLLWKEAWHTDNHMLSIDNWFYLCQYTASFIINHTVFPNYMIWLNNSVKHCYWVSVGLLCQYFNF